MAVALDFDMMAAEVERRLGRPFEPPSHVSIGLSMLLREADARGKLTREGRRLLQHEVLRVMTQRALLESAISAQSDTVRGEVVVITGLPRTGSTLLHNLMADLGVYAWLPLWQSLEPSIRADDADTADCVRRARDQLRYMQAISPDLLNVHPMREDRPEECLTLMQLTGASDRFSISLSVPDYCEWTKDSDVVDSTYRDYARILNVVLGPKRPILLKAPSHAPNVATIATRMPQSTILWLERSIDEVEESFARLVLASRRVFQSEASASDWSGRWRGLEPPPGAPTLRLEDVRRFVQDAAATMGVPAPRAERHSSWLRATTDTDRWRTEQA